MLIHKEDWDLRLPDHPCHRSSNQSSMIDMQDFAAINSWDWGFADEVYQYGGLLTLVAH